MTVNVPINTSNCGTYPDMAVMALAFIDTPFAYRSPVIYVAFERFINYHFTGSPIIYL